MDIEFVKFVLVNFGPMVVVSLGFAYFIHYLVTKQMPEMQRVFIEELKEQRTEFTQELKDQRKEFTASLAAQSLHTEMVTNEVGGKIDRIGEAVTSLRQDISELKGAVGLKRGG
jgi:hypothetical protein